MDSSACFPESLYIHLPIIQHDIFVISTNPRTVTLLGCNYVIIMGYYGFVMKTDLRFNSRRFNNSMIMTI